MNAFDNAALFNCCTDYAEPEWTRFDALELGGCCDASDCPEDGTFIESGYERSEAEFFTVYGHLKHGGAEAITDITGFEKALEIIGHLSVKSGLHFAVYC